MNESIEVVLGVCERIPWYDATGMDLINDESVVEIAVGGLGDITSVGPWTVFALITHDLCRYMLMMKTHINSTFVVINVEQERLRQLRTTIKPFKYHTKS